MFRRKYRRVRFLAENVLLQAGRNILVEPWNLRSASAHYNYIRIEKIDDLRQTAREPVFESIERGERGSFACAASSDNLGTLEKGASRTLIIRFQARSGYPRFDAAVPPAITRGTGKLFRLHPRQCVVPPFARNSIPTAVHAAIDRNSSAASSAQNDRKNDVLARTRAVGRFRNRQAVGVIRASHFAPQRPAQVLVERFPVPPCGVGVFHQTGPRGNGTGDAQAHRRAAAKLFLDSFNTFNYGADRAFIVEARRGDAVTVQFPSVSLDRDQFDLSASKIDSDSNGLLFFLSGWHSGYLWGLPQTTSYVLSRC